MPALAPALTATVLSHEQWRALEAEHETRANELTAGRQDRALRGEKHPIEDFLFTYYPSRVSALQRWHPGAGVELEGAAADQVHAERRWYRAASDGGALLTRI